MRLKQQIDDYLDAFRSGDADSAFHGLRELGPQCVPELMAAYGSQQDTAVRELLVSVIWQYREQSTIPFLAQALSDSEPRIWRQALDGLVALASPAGLDVLRAARTRDSGTRRTKDDFYHWLEEAIGQAESR